MNERMDRVELVIPASAEYVVLARLTVAGIASRMGMSYDDIEDLRVIAAETCRLLVPENGSVGTVSIRYTVAPTGLEIEAVGRTDPPPPSPTEDDLSIHLLSALADEHEVVVDAGECRVRVVKRRQA